MTRHSASLLLILCTALATALLLASAASADDLAVRVIDRAPDVRNLDTTDTIKWYADESIDYTVRPRRGGVPVSIPGDATATWIIADAATGTNYLSAVAASQTSNSVTFHLPLGGAALPEGVDEWVSFVSLLQGTNFLGVIDRCRAECLWSPYTSAAALIPTTPLPELLRQFATTSYVAAAIADMGNGFPLANNADFASFDAQNVGGVQFDGSTNILAFGDGTLLYGGMPIAVGGESFGLTTNGDGAFTNFAFPRGISMESPDIPEITQYGLPHFNFNGLVRYRYANADWLSLVGYPCVGLYGLNGALEITVNGPLLRGGLGFYGAAKRLEVANGELTFGGEPIGSGICDVESGKGIAVAISTDNVATVSTALTAGHGITISTNAENTALAIAAPRDIDFDDVTIRGDLEVYGTEYRTRVIHQEVVVDQGTNYTHTVRHTTNYVDERVVVTQVTRTTNTVDELVTIGGDVDHYRATWVREPSFTIDNSNTNLPSLAATGAWDFTLASIDFGDNLPDLSGYASKDWVNNQGFLKHHQSLDGYAKEFWVSTQLSGYAPKSSFDGVSNRVNTIESTYITPEKLDAKLEDYAPSSSITVITNDIEEIVSALSNPVIQTPDHKKWTMQGRYLNGHVSHVWVPYVGVYSSSIRVPMSDGRIFEMVGRYADGNTNYVTHIWQEVVE